MGGVQVRLARIVSAMGRRYRHRIFAIDGILDCASHLDAALAVEVSAAPRLGRFLPGALMGARRHLMADRPDLLVTYNWGAMDWALANRLFAVAAHVHFEDGFGPDESDIRLRRRSTMRRWALARADRIVVPSRALKSIALGEWRLPPTRVIHVPNGIDADSFASRANADQPPPFERRPGEVVIGTVAPLRPEKNLGRLIRAFAAAEAPGPARLAIAGGGPQQAELQQLARRLGIGDRVVFLGLVAAPQRALALFDVFALSSDTEQMPMSVLEAMATGLPVAAVDVGDVKRMLAPANRHLIVPKSDEPGLAAALAGLIAAPDRRAELGRLNHAHVRETYSFDAMVAAYDRVFSAR